MTMRSGGRILVDQLRIQGCDRIFKVPGENFLAVLDATARANGTIPKRLG
jgi:acetolactate synthase-1/2/3 large subunit